VLAVVEWQNWTRIDNVRFGEIVSTPCIEATVGFRCKSEVDFVFNKGAFFYSLSKQASLT
jgi:hypothetical protein